MMYLAYPESGEAKAADQSPTGIEFNLEILRGN